MDKKAKKYILVGYQGDSTNYRLYDPEEEKVISRNVIFDETPVTPVSSDMSTGIRLPVNEDKERNVNEL